MNFTKETVYQTNHTIIDADVSLQKIVVLKKGKGEHIVTINDSDKFSVCTNTYMIRILGDSLVTYDGHTVQFFTLEGLCTKKVEIGSHLFELLPMKNAVACTYRDQGVFEHEMGAQKIVVLHKDGTVTSHKSFANEHHLDFDIRFARVKPYACVSTETNSIIHFTSDFHVQKTLQCPFNIGDVIAMSYRYPYYIFLEENKIIILQEDGTYIEKNGNFSLHIRSNYHRGRYVFLEILKHEIIGWIIS